MRRRLPALTLLAACVVLGPLLSGCTAGDTPKDGVPETTTPATSPASPPSSPPSSPPTSAATASPPRVEQLEGIDVSHHQGAIDWARVAASGISFAYLKATEGTGFVDPRFAAHRRDATRAGLLVSGYHYFQLCSDGAAQAEHFLRVLTAEGPPTLAPAIDLELAGSCSDPPPRAELLAEVRAFLEVVERRLSQQPVVYLFPEFEERFGFAADLAAHPQWVRRLGDRPPQRRWQVWQYDDSGAVPGIVGGVDRNRLQRRVG